MFGKNISMDVFHRRVLKCVQEKKWTTEEIWICYLKSYPQGLIEKVLVHPVTKAKIVLALHIWFFKILFIKRSQILLTNHLMKKQKFFG